MRNVLSRMTTPPGLPPRRSRFVSLVIAGVALFVLGTACAIAGALYLWKGQTTAAPVTITPRGDLSEAEQSTVALFREASPSVVFITKLAVRSDPFRRNFQQMPEGTGSGFIWDQRGHVVTNYHVIEGASGARVTLADQSSWPAELVGYVGEKDIAVLRIDAPSDVLRPIPVGTSGDLVVGQHCFAIGNPFGLDHTLSTGVVSGLEREIMSIGRRPIQGVIQTDAAINPGNSGGPLLDSAGRLIGMNTAIYSPSGASAGIGFAVPVDTLVRIVPQLITHGRVTRPALGVHLAERALTDRLRLNGALVIGVEPGSPAAAANIVPTRQDPYGRLILGDAVVALNGQPVRDALDLYRLLDRQEVGDEVVVSLERDGQRRDARIRLAGVAAE